MNEGHLCSIGILAAYIGNASKIKQSLIRMKKENPAKSASKNCHGQLTNVCSGRKITHALLGEANQVRQTLLGTRAGTLKKGSRNQYGVSGLICLRESGFRGVAILLSRFGV